MNSAAAIYIIEYRLKNFRTGKREWTWIKGPWTKHSCEKYLAGRRNRGVDISNYRIKRQAKSQRTQ